MTIKERRRLAAANGYCATCRRRRPDNGMRTCAKCLSDRNARAASHGRKHPADARFKECCQSHDVHRFDCEHSTNRQPLRRLAA